MKKFFSIIKSVENHVTYTLKEPCRILIQNIRKQWLQSTLSKTQKHLPVFLDKKCYEKTKDRIPYGFITQNIPKYNDCTVFEHYFSELVPKDSIKSEIKFNLVIPEQEIMQYFIQWQRYRKYWWSSITTTPSLFGIEDIKYGESSADANIVAKFPWGPHTVETVTVHSTGTDSTSNLTCAMTLEGALFTLLLDGLTNSTKEEYLRLHRKIAPYKFSFALDDGAPDKKEVLNDLATLIYNRLTMKKISTLLPNLSLPLESQVKENLRMGVAYTAILSEDTLTNGIFHLMNSSTMLKEQVHVADFDSYATLICGK